MIRDALHVDIRLLSKTGERPGNILKSMFLFLFLFFYFLFFYFSSSIENDNEHNVPIER